MYTVQPLYVEILRPRVSRVHLRGIAPPRRRGQRSTSSYAGSVKLLVCARALRLIINRSQRAGRLIDTCVYGRAQVFLNPRGDAPESLAATPCNA